MVMINSIVEKLDSTLNEENLKLFSLEDLISNRMIPLCQKGSEYFVVIDEKRQTSEAKQLCQKVLNMPIKFLPVDYDIVKILIDKNIDKIERIQRRDLDKIDNTSSQQMDNASDKEKERSDAVNKSEINENTSSKVVNKAISSPFKENASIHKRIGDLLKERGLITNDILSECLLESQRLKVPIGSILVEHGKITVQQLREVLSLQQGVDFIRTEKLKIDPNVLRLLPEEFMRYHKIIPIESDGKTLVLGMVNPQDRRALNEVVALTGRRPSIRLITYIELERLLNEYFNKSDIKNESTKYIETIIQESKEYDDGEESLSAIIDREIQDATGGVAKFSNKIVTDGIEMGTSDIHIEPRQRGYVVRFRIDGILKQVMEIPDQVESALITRFKVLAKMNIAEHRRPQDGTFTMKYKDTSYDFRINTLPVNGKEKMCIRILAPAVSISSTNEKIVLKGAVESDTLKVQRMAQLPNGIILVSGPTGSGKTTTLYSILKSLNNEAVNITTIEDPVEIKIEGLNQSQVNPKADITFATNMKAILRQDPDIIMIGEIRDYETLEVAISAALTGHLVLSTVHTNSAAATVTRLIEMGAKDYLVASTVAGVIAQRLVRKLCPHCRKKTKPTLEQAQLVIANPENYRKFMESDIYEKVGCDKCKMEGYQGRIGLYEVLNITSDIRKLIAKGTIELELHEAAIAQGMTTLSKACMQHILAGETTVDEYVRVLGPVND